MGKKWTKKRNQAALDRLALEIEDAIGNAGFAFSVGIRRNEEWAMSWVCDKSNDFLAITHKGKAYKKVTDVIGQAYDECIKGTQYDKKGTSK